MLLLAAKVTSSFDELTRPERVKVLILDDSIIPVGFNMLFSANKNNCYQEISTDIDHHTNGYKSRTESFMKNPDAAILLIQRALTAGIPGILFWNGYVGIKMTRKFMVNYFICFVMIYRT